MDWGEEKGPGVALIHERGTHRHQDSLLRLGTNVRIIGISTLVGIGQYMPQRSHNATDLMREIY